MRTQDLKSDDYRPCFSGHETFPLRYGWLQKAYRAVDEAASPKDAVHVFRDPESIARFGVGRNMVGAIRYWATATGILNETNPDYSPEVLDQRFLCAETVSHLPRQAGSLRGLSGACV